jgi:hypothetical protein
MRKEATTEFACKQVFRLVAMSYEQTAISLICLVPFVICYQL